MICKLSISLDLICAVVALIDAVVLKKMRMKQRLKWRQWQTDVGVGNPFFPMFVGGLLLSYWRIYSFILYFIFLLTLYLRVQDQKRRHSYLFLP